MQRLLALAAQGTTYHEFNLEPTSVVLEGASHERLDGLLLAQSVYLQQVLQSLRGQLQLLLHQLLVALSSLVDGCRVLNLGQGQHRVLDARHFPTLDGVYVGDHQVCQHCKEKSNGQVVQQALGPYFLLGGQVAVT